jgi:hypothetical protein
MNTHTEANKEKRKAFSFPNTGIATTGSRDQQLDIHSGECLLVLMKQHKRFWVSKKFCNRVNP